MVTTMSSWALLGGAPISGAASGWPSFRSMHRTRGGVSLIEPALAAAGDEWVKPAEGLIAALQSGLVTAGLALAGIGIIALGIGGR